MFGFAKKSNGWREVKNNFTPKVFTFVVRSFLKDFNNQRPKKKQRKSICAAQTVKGKRLLGIYEYLNVDVESELSGCV